MLRLQVCHTQARGSQRDGEWKDEKYLLGSAERYSLMQTQRLPRAFCFRTHIQPKPSSLFREGQAQYPATNPESIDEAARCQSRVPLAMAFWFNHDPTLKFCELAR